MPLAFKRKHGTDENGDNMLIARYSKDFSKSQSMAEHACTVAEYAEENLRPLGLPALGVLSGLLHDLGKSLSPWQNALEAERQKYLQGKAVRQSLEVPHAPPSARIIYQLLKDQAGNAVQKACLQILCMAIAAHHGYLMDVLTLEGQDVFEKTIQGEQLYLPGDLENFYQEVKPRAEIERLFLLACDELSAVFSKVPSASDHSGNNKVHARRFHFGMVARAVYAALIDADRLDAARFGDPAKRSEPKGNIPDWQALLSALEGKLNAFPNTRGIDQKRRFISEQCAAAGSQAEGITALHAPTGSGKTLASLRWALNKAQAKKRRRIYYVVSFTTILDQVYGDYLEALQNSSYQADILLHHSNLIPEEPGESTDSGHQSHTRELRQLALAERWEADIILTTQVQFFNALFLGTGKAARRLRGLSNAVIIFDEVQTIPPQLTYLFNLAINHLTVICNCDVMLSSATQPQYGSMDYPLLPVKNVFEMPDELFAGMRRVRLIDRRNLGWLDAAGLAEFAVQEQKQWQSVLVVLNTRAAARKTYEALTQMELPEVDIHLLSNDLCPAHRQSIIAMLKTMDKPCICVSTQLIECGVNLSFGCAIRSMAGADNIWQTAGRCNRHDDGSIHPVYIIKCVEENLDMLRDIREARDAATLVLDALPEADSLQLPSAMTQYYRHYYQHQQDQLAFPVSVGDKHTSLVQLLSSNQKALETLQENKPQAKPSQPLFQAFTTAGRIFTVIDSPAQALITPYKQGKELILSLNGQVDLEQEKRLLREAQFYSINIFQQQLKRLASEDAILMLPCGALALKQEWYDSKKRGLLNEPEYDVQAMMP